MKKERRKQMLLLISRFSKDFDASLEGLSDEEQLIITKTLRNVLPLFEHHTEVYYEKFYAIYEKEILETLRHKAKKISALKLTDYFDQGSFKLVDLQHELKIDDDDQFLSNTEYKSFIQKVSNLINHKHQMLLLTDPAIPDSKKSKPLSNVHPVESRKQEPTKTELKESDEFITIPECALLLKVSAVTIHKYKKQGMPYYGHGRTIRFKKDEVLKFMSSQKRKK